MSLNPVLGRPINRLVISQSPRRATVNRISFRWLLAFALIALLAPNANATPMSFTPISEPLGEVNLFGVNGLGPLLVGSFQIPPLEDITSGVSIRGTFGNGLSNNSAGVDLRLGDELVAQCITGALCWRNQSPTAWRANLSSNDVGTLVLGGGSEFLQLTATQTGPATKPRGQFVGGNDFQDTLPVVRLGQTFLEIPLINPPRTVSISQEQFRTGASAAVSAIGLLFLPPPTTSLGTWLERYQIIDVAYTGYTFLNSKDPFDPNFGERFSPQFHSFPPVLPGAEIPVDLANSINENLAHAARALAFEQAINATLNRLSSAGGAGDGRSTALQLIALRDFEQLAADELRLYKSGLLDIASRIRGTPLDRKLTASEVSAFLNDLRSKGFDVVLPQEATLFDLFNVTSDAKTLGLGFLNTLDPTQVPLSLSDALTEDAAAFDALAQSYSGTTTPPITVTPEPTTLLLFGTTMAGLGLTARWRRRRQN